jgi:hypothetical protein
MNDSDVVQMSSQEAIYMHSRAVDLNQDSGEISVPRERRESEGKVPTTETFYLMIPRNVRRDVLKYLQETKAERLYVSITKENKACDNWCPNTNSKIVSLIQLESDQFQLLHSPPPSPSPSGH